MEWCGISLGIHHQIRYTTLHMQSHVFSIDDLHATVAEKAILKGVSLTVKSGEVHAIMGPNGSGKSTLANTVAGHPFYTVTGGEMSMDGESLLSLSPDQRATKGLFLAFQYPSEVPGVRVYNFLHHAYKERFKDQPERSFPTVLAFRKHVDALAETLQVNKALLSRGLNEGFSGGEKKRLEILQMALLEPTFAILDETDSGLDVDAIKAVALGVKTIIEKFNTGVIVITHYQRILKYLEPQFVHIMREGVIVEHGGVELVEKVETKGYKEE